MSVAYKSSWGREGFACMLGAQGKNVRAILTCIVLDAQDLLIINDILCSLRHQKLYHKIKTDNLEQV